jgi:hypothetical protein
MRQGMVVEKVGCTKCGTLILAATAQKTGGLCMPCSAGTRASIEKSKTYHEKERELDRTAPERLLWKSLVRRVHAPGGGFDTLSAPEKKYFATGLLLGEVYNGGFDQFFHNHAGEYFLVVCETLMELGAKSSLRLLRQAKEIIFGNDSVPLHTPSRRQYLASHPIKDDDALNLLDKEFWSDPDALYDKLSAFAREHGLLVVAA